MNWSLNSTSREWFNIKGHNSILPIITNNLQSLDDINRIIVGSNNLYNRWDISWLFHKSLLLYNRCGSLASHLNSFAIQIINNILPTLDHLICRHPTLYAGWMCHFCDNEQESLSHLLTCPALSAKWHDIEQATINGLVSWCTVNKIQLPDNPKDILYTSPCIVRHGIHSRSTIQALARGISPAYMLANMNTLKIRHNKVQIACYLLFQATIHFRAIIWKPRCSLQADKEKSFDITARSKRSYSNNSRVIRTRPPDDHSAYFTAQIKWSTAIQRGSAIMEEVLKKGHSAMDKGWAMVRGSMGKLVKFNSRDSAGT